MAVSERYAEGRMRLMPVGLVEDGRGETLVYPVDKGSGATTSLVEADGVVEVPADTERLDEGETVTVQSFSPNVRTPTVYGVGEDDPALSRLLDRVERPRYLALGSREGLRRLRNGVPDVAVTSAPGDPGFETEELGSWTREWGLVVPEGNPAGVSGLGDLVDADLRFVNRTSNAGLRTTLGNALADLAAERDEDRHDLVSTIEGFDAGVRAHESPARRVRAGKADVGLGLRATADSLGMGFVPCGSERVRLLGNPDRIEKPGVRALADAVADGADVFDALTGYDAD
jgi:putative molybdopterin biosynthesis protein